MPRYNYRDLPLSSKKRACEWAVSRQGIKDSGKPWTKRDNQGSFQRLWIAIGSGQFYISGGKYKISKNAKLDYPAAWCQYFCNASYIIGGGGDYRTWVVTPRYLAGRTQSRVAAAKRVGAHFTNLRAARPGDWIYMGRNWNNGSYHVEVVIANNFGIKGQKDHLITIGGNSSPPPGSREKREGVYKHRRNYDFLTISGHAIVRPWNW